MTCEVQRNENVSKTMKPMTFAEEQVSPTSQATGLSAAILALGV